MKLPLFLFIEGSSYDEDAFPVSIAWSLEDGSIKSVLIIPDDEWDPWDNAGLDTDIHLLQEQGVSGPDIIRELNEDLDGNTVFVEGINHEDELLEKLFETYGNEPGFELATVKELYKDKDIESILTLRSDLSNEYNLNQDTAEDIVRANVLLAHKLEKS